jgi:hypothetical protein
VQLSDVGTVLADADGAPAVADTRVAVVATGGADFEDLPQLRKAVRGLALDGAGRAAQHLADLVDRDVAQEAQHEHGTLAGGQPGQRSAQRRRGFDVARFANALLGHRAEQADSEPGPSSLVDMRTYHDRPYVAIEIVRVKRASPAEVKLGDRLLDQVVGPVLVPAEQKS